MTSQNAFGTQGISATTAMQVALVVITLAAAPVSGWLFIANYVEDNIDTAILRLDAATQQTAFRNRSKIDDLEFIVDQLCRKADFDCLTRPAVERYPALFPNGFPR